MHGLRPILNAAGRPAVAAACFACAILAGLGAFFVTPPAGAIAELYGPAFQRPRLLARIVPAIEPRMWSYVRFAPTESFTARWTTALDADREGWYEFELAADDRAALSINGHRVIEPAAEAGIQHSSAMVRLNRGFHLLSIEYEQFDGGAFMDVHVSQDGAPAKPLSDLPLIATGSPKTVSVRRAAGVALWILAALLIAPLLWSILVLRVVPHPAWIGAIVLALVVAWGGALRLDAMLGRTGEVDRPGWLHAIDLRARLALTRVAPVEFQWMRVPRMFQQGDPAGYVFFAREMRSFYAAHPREPLFVGLTRALLPVADYQDVAVGLASTLSSLALIVAVYFLGSLIGSRFVGLFAATGLAIERDAIEWSIDGWRDETFALLFVAFACVAILARERFDLRRAAMLGIVTAAALLTRVTSLAFIATGLLALAINAFRHRHTASLRTMVAPALTTAAVTAVLAGPYFLNCYRTFGNALYSIDVHTQFYRDREGLPSKQPLSAAAYLRNRFTEHPVRETGVVVSGMTTYSFVNKWQGYDEWLPYLGRAAAALSAAGLLLLLFRDSGRLLLLITAGSLVPYAATHDIQGGSEWRFTLHVYPVLLVAAGLALERIASALWSWRTARREVAGTVRAHRRAFIAATVLVILAAGTAYLWPYVLLGEDMWFGRPYSITADANHALLFADGWSEPATAGNVTSRWSNAQTGSIWLPIAANRAHHFRFRIDPNRIEPHEHKELRVYVNRQLVSAQPMQLVEGRVGAYDVVVPDHALHRGFNRLDLLVTHSGGTDGDDAAEPERIRFWYVKVTAM